MRHPASLAASRVEGIVIHGARRAMLHPRRKIVAAASGETAPSTTRRAKNGQDRGEGHPNIFCFVDAALGASREEAVDGASDAGQDDGLQSLSSRHELHTVSTFGLFDHFTLDAPYIRRAVVDGAAEREPTSNLDRSLPLNPPHGDQTQRRGRAADRDRRSPSTASDRPARARLPCCHRPEPR